MNANYEIMKIHFIEDIDIIAIISGNTKSYITNH